jgi:2-C-methyl-D-erythritol 4-phosphate cytidylyltransferase
MLNDARTRRAVAPGIALADTVKRVGLDGRVVETPPRAEMRAVQTPQVFAGELLRRAHALADGDATDDASLVERLGEPVYVVEGERTNIKVTTPEDLERARELLRARR